jgi:hypothetical protein
MASHRNDTGSAATFGCSTEHNGKDDPCHNSTSVGTRSNKKALVQDLLMGGTGLEPVTPSLSRWCSRSRQFAGVRSDRLVERNPPASERLSERERTPILAILATRVVTSSTPSSATLT